MTEPIVHSVEPGSKIGRFVVGRELGSGGMGTVFEARDPELSRVVAVKLLSDRRADPVRLLREAQALARVSHPNVVAVYELGSFGDQVFVAMELVDGVTIDQHLDERPRSWREVLALYLQAGRGLAAVHAEGLVHRDIKPSNLLVDRAGRVRVGDFGLARDDQLEARATRPRAGEQDARSTAITVDAIGPAEPGVRESDARGLLGAVLTASGAVLGTPRYMAPEQHLGERVTHRADQFGFCVALWEGLYGEHPFHDGDRRALAVAVLEGRLRPPKGRGVPSWIERVLARGLAPSPDARWPSMGALVDVLERTPRRRRAIALAIAAIAVAGAAVTGVALFAGGGKEIACDHAGEPVTVAWSPERRAAVRTAFGALGAAWGDTAGRAELALDRWAGRWSDARVDTCRATHDRGEQSPALLDKRVACLDGQLAAFSALVAALARIDEAAARHASSAIDRLPAPETCNAARLAGAVAPSSDPRVTGVELAIAEAQAALELRGSELKAKAERAVVAARALGAPDLRARASFIHAQAIIGTDPKAGRAAFDEALADAATAHDPAIEAAIVMRQLVIAAEDGTVDRIDALIPAARAAVTRAGEPRPLQLELAMAELAANAQLARIAPARAACDRAVELADSKEVATEVASYCRCVFALVQRHDAVTACADSLAATRTRHGAGHPRVAMAAHRHITALVRANQLAEADAAGRAQQVLLERLFGATSRDVADGLQLISVIEDRQGKVAESRATLERALAIVEQLGGQDDPARAGLLTELSDRAAQQGDRAAAMRYADAGLAASERRLGADHPDMATVLMFHAKAIGTDPAQLARALASWDRAMTIALRAQGPQSREFAAIASSYSYFLAVRDRYAPALVLAERALPVFDELHDELAAARMQGLIGEIHLELGHRGKARTALEAARARFVKLGEPVKDELAAIEATQRRAR